MKGKHDGWAPIGNGSVHCLGPGFFTLHQACTQGHQQVRTEQNVWVHYSLHGDGLPFLVDVQNLHPCNETTRSVFPSNQVISPQMGTWVREQSSQILIIIPALPNTDLLGMYSFSPMHVFQGCSQPAEKLLEGRVRLCIPFCTFHLHRNFVSMIRRWWNGYCHWSTSTNAPGGWKVTISFPRRKLFLLRSLLYCKAAPKGLLFIVFNSSLLPAPFHWCWD